MDEQHLKKQKFQTYIQKKDCRMDSPTIKYAFNPLRFRSLYASPAATGHVLVRKNRRGSKGICKLHAIL